MNDILVRAVPPAAAPSLEETRATLLSMAKGRFGRIAPGRIVEQVLRVTEGADWPVRKAALEALGRRLGFAARDGVRVSQRPGGGRTLGSYRVARGKRAGARAQKDAAYETALLSVEPLCMSCGCADFVRSSLGLCKHALVVLQALEASGALARAEKERPSGGQRGRLGWSAVHPLTGQADRLARLTHTAGARAVALEGFARGRPLPGVLAAPKRRLAFIAELQRALARGRLEAEPAS